MKTELIHAGGQQFLGGTRTPCGLSGVASRLASKTNQRARSARSTSERIPFLTLGLGALALFVYSQLGWTEALEFSRAGLAHGQLWRLFTGHLTHFSADHLKWDLAVFVALGSLVELRNRWHFVVSVIGGALLISLGVAWLQPQFASYRGLSGIDSALFGYIAMDILKLARAEGRHGPAVATGVAMLFFVAKTIFELVSGRTVFVGNTGGFAPVPLAHLIGAIVGGATVWNGAGGFVRRVLGRTKISPNHSQREESGARSVDPGISHDEIIPLADDGPRRRIERLERFTAGQRS